MAVGEGRKASGHAIATLVLLLAPSWASVTLLANPLAPGCRSKLERGILWCTKARVHAIAVLVLLRTSAPKKLLG